MIKYAVRQADGLYLSTRIVWPPEFGSLDRAQVYGSEDGALGVIELLKFWADIAGELGPKLPLEVALVTVTVDAWADVPGSGGLS